MDNHMESIGGGRFSDNYYVTKCLDKTTDELAMVGKDIRALRDSFGPWLDEVWWKFAWTENKSSSVKKYKSEQCRTWKDVDRETIFVYSINNFWIRLVVFLWISIRSSCKIRSYEFVYNFWIKI